MAPSLYHFYATEQRGVLTAKQATSFTRHNPTYSTNPDGEEHWVSDISNNGVYNASTNQVE